MHRSQISWVLVLVVSLHLLSLSCHFKGSNSEESAFSTELSAPSKIYALFFPQFHKDKLNDELWGSGYTDWDSVRKAPQRNRYGDSVIRPSQGLGYYDQTKYPVRKRQGELAKLHGIDGFIYHHYWFHQPNMGAPLSAPLEAMLLDGEPNVSFAFNYAKENWSATWHGKGKTEKEILVEQRCPAPDDPLVFEHYNFLRRFFKHPNYITVKGAPLFSVYGWDFSKPCIAMLEKYRALAMQDGFPAPGLHILGAQLQMATHEMYTGVPKIPDQPLFDGDSYYPYSTAPMQQLVVPPHCFRGEKGKERKPTYVSTLCEFDNTPRRKFDEATVWRRNFTALTIGKSFEYDIVQLLMYDRCCQNPEARAKGGNFILLNAFNEWGEGMAMEPSGTKGYIFLAAVRRAKMIAASLGCNWPALQLYNADPEMV